MAELALVPIQVLDGSYRGNDTDGNDGRTATRNPNRRRRNRNRNRKNNNNNQGSNDNKDNHSGTNNSDANATQDQKEEVRQKSGPSPSRNRNRSRRGNGAHASITLHGPDQLAKNATKEDRKTGEGLHQNHQNQKKSNNNRNRNRNRRKNKGKFPWRSHLPRDSVDPITLEPLNQLTYPPFALVADEPYDIVPIWPVPKEEAESDNGTKELGEAEVLALREKRILEEQWGTDKAPTQAEKATPKKTPPGQRHFNLYDGRALAYYMVSQLQFIDPLNRRDLTRDELVNLDHYLRRHGFGQKFRVVEAYDEKGVTISTAGAAANTASGRAAILQQQGQVLLNALFGGGGVGDSHSENQQPTRARQSNALADQYAASQRSQQQQLQRSIQPPPQRDPDDGLYGDDEGLLIIDDDYNPGLRGDLSESTETHEAERGQQVGSLWSASHITGQCGTGVSFPVLSAAPAAADQSQQIKPRPKQTKASSRSLQRITGMVKKTDQKELERQQAARNEFVRRAQLSNMTLGQTKPAVEQSGLLIAPTPQQEIPASQGVLLRNQAFASALQIEPATLRHYNSGWKRPTTFIPELDEFGNELNAAIYPDELLLQARERVPLVLKLEKKWKNFLEDNTAASLPLNPMDKPTRAFVHHYSDFYNLHTESFDPEPKRYIHCVKLRDTSVPKPLLSEALRTWRGPTTTRSFAPPRRENHPIKQTAGETPLQRGDVHDCRRKSPPPHFLPTGMQPPPGAMFELIPAQTQTMEPIQGSRAEGLIERPKLNLAPRTKPLELPPMSQTGTSSYNVAEERARQAALREDRSLLQQKQEAARREALESAFASDSDKESSEWEEEEAEELEFDDEEQ